MTRKEFHFIDGSSKKFWAIQIEGNSLIVHYGRIGASGQTQEKSFATTEAARREHDKLIAEKSKKGYVEVGAGASTAVAPISAGTVRKPSEVATAKQTDEAPPQSVAADPCDVRPPPPAAVIGELDRRIDLEPKDRFVVTWMDHPPLAKPEPSPFDIESCLQRLRLVGTTNQQWAHDWRKARIPEFPSTREAQFWLLAFAQCRKAVEAPQEVADQLGKAVIDGTMPPREVVETCAGSGHMPENLFACVTAFVPPEALAMGGWTPGLSLGPRLAIAFRNYVLPYLTAELRAEIKQSLAAAIAPIMPATYYDSFPSSYYLGALFGLHEQLLAVVQRLPDDHYKTDAQGFRHDYYQGPQWLVFGLGDAVTVETEFRRLGIKLRNKEQATAWLALTEYAALDVIASSACEATSKDDAAKSAGALALVTAPEAAVPALRILINSKAPLIGRDWLARHPLHAVVGLVPAAMGQGKVAEAAREHLRTVRRGESASALSAVAQHLPADQGAWLQEEIAEAEEAALPEMARDEFPAPLRALFDEVKPSKPPQWLSLASLPPIKIGGKRLGGMEVEALLSTLKATPAGASAPLVSALKEVADSNALDAFAWKLFDSWNGMGAPSKDKWALGGIGHLGGDACVLKLTPLLRAWPGESQHQRAVFGLECLRAVGSDTALMALNNIAQKLKFKGLKEKAQAMMEGIAESRGFTREQLADRIVPDCGLDERGSRIFDFGPRQFRFVLGPEMKPLVRDAAGKARPDLPGPNSSDDRDKAEAAVAEWKLLKKTLREALKIQADRLEDAMITGRRWIPEEFSALLIKHPLMVNIARQLVFAVFDETGKITQSFRITDDQTLADQNDDPIALSSIGQIGVAHPAHLDDATKEAWGQVLSDYEIIPPFQQLGRTIFRPEPEDVEKTEITRYRGPKAPGIVMYGMLERSHWLRDIPADGGGFSQHSKHFPSANLTAFIQYSGMSIGYYDEPQELESVYFVPGHVKPDWWGDHKNRLKIEEVDGVVLSEVLRLANAIVSKAA
jgi:predicted DNA-binding WGR domain protein